jgi:hypothetical protein
LYTVLNVRELRAMLRVAEKMDAAYKAAGLGSDLESTTVVIHSEIAPGWTNGDREQNSTLHATVNGESLLQLAYGR